MNADRLAATVLPPLFALVATWVTAHYGAGEVTTANERCGEIIAAIYGQLEPDGE